ncbi:MAG: hypothetical protein LLF94_10795 [Chlamydiales bacterium]|nr:hypothetical protein [Chlamydiales bacterium]
MAWSVVTSAAAVAGTVIAPILETWEQAGIKQAALACQNIVSNTCHAGRIFTPYGMALPFVVSGNSLFSVLAGHSIGRRFPCTSQQNVAQSDEEFCCKIKAYATSMSVALLVFGVAVTGTIVVIKSHAEPTAYAIGSECMNRTIDRTIANITSCSSLDTALENYNGLGTLSWVVTNVATFTLGGLLGRVSSPCQKKPQEGSAEEIEELL